MSNIQTMVGVTIERLRDNAELPRLGSPGAAGFDVQACLDEPVVLAPGEARLIPTGFALDMTGIPGMYAMIFARSGTGHKLGLVLGNGTGIIDNDYRGELYVSALNRSQAPITIMPGDRIAQLLFGIGIAHLIKFQVATGDELASTERGSGGFGSTGR